MLVFSDLTGKELECVEEKGRKLNKMCEKKFI
jgi:hypothetical protein